MTSQTLALGAVSTVTAFIMSDAMWALLVAQIGTIAIMLVKDRRDIRNREQDRLDRESAARLAREEIAKVVVAGGERENRIVAEVKTVKTAVEDSMKGPTQVEVVNDFGHPVPTTSANS